MSANGEGKVATVWLEACAGVSHVFLDIDEAPYAI